MACLWCIERIQRVVRRSPCSNENMHVGRDGRTAVGVKLGDLEGACVKGGFCVLCVDHHTISKTCMYDVNRRTAVGVKLGDLEGACVKGGVLVMGTSVRFSGKRPRV
jgi:hypothetical protein